MLQSRRPIQIGDSIESLGYVGNVKAINGLSVVLETLDGQTVHLPNTEVLDNPIVNDSVNGRRRSDFEVRVAAGVERLDDVHGVVAQAIAATPAVDQAVPPQVTTAAIERGRLTLLVRLWHDPSQGRTVRSAAMHEIATGAVRARAGRNAAGAAARRPAEAARHRLSRDGLHDSLRPSELEGGEMWPAIGDLLPSAVGVALSPVPIIAVIMMLGTPKARSNGPAFAVGWVAGLVIVSVIVVLVASGSDDPDSVTAGKSLGLGALLSGANPKNLALTLRQAAWSPYGGRIDMPTMDRLAANGLTYAQ